MFGSSILDVAIGITFVYLLLSLICSAVNEVIEAGLKNRAKDLEKGIYRLLADPGLGDRLYGHPLIRGLFTEEKGKPSYIPARVFTVALLNILLPDTALSAPDTGENKSSSPPADLRNRISKFTLDQPSAAQSKDTDAPTGVILNPINQAMLSLLDDAQGNLEKFRANIEGWYDASMDRVSGWYKRRVQIIILVLGIGVSVAVNADSAYVARRLSNDPALRNTLVSAAEAFAKAQADAAISNSNTQLANGDAAKVTESSKTELDSAASKFNRNLAEIEKLGLPIGWSLEGEDVRLRWPGARLWKPEVASAWLVQFRFHWFGWLMTAFAISMGAPFWFDLLDKFIVVRSTVKPKQKSSPEGTSLRPLTLTRR